MKSLGYLAVLVDLISSSPLNTRNMLPEDELFVTSKYVGIFGFWIYNIETLVSG
jgi:hypothetical protein